MAIDKQTSDATARVVSRLVIVAGCAWLVFIAWRTYAGWPVVPLDIDLNDPAVRASYRAAVVAHALHALALASAGIFIVAAAVWALRRR